MSKWKLVKTRKDYKCSNCGKLIPKGSICWIDYANKDYQTNDYITLCLNCYES